MKYINDNKDSIKRDMGLDITSTLLEQGGINASKFGVFINTAGGVKRPKPVQIHLWKSNVHQVNVFIEKW